jgi:hypothetical protein
MDKLETAITSLADADAGKARSDMSAACNTFDLNGKAFVELMAAQKPKTRKVWKDICWHWIGYLSAAYMNKVLHDRRNEHSCYTGYHIFNSVSEKHSPLKDLPKDSFVSTYIAEMGHGHRTIQQSFSSLVFAWLNYEATVKNDAKAKLGVKCAKSLLGERWYIMPLI